jgi:hypothetical protein
MRKSADRSRKKAKAGSIVGRPDSHFNQKKLNFLGRILLATKTTKSHENKNWEDGSPKNRAFFPY